MVQQAGGGAMAMDLIEDANIARNAMTIRANRGLSRRFLNQDFRLTYPDAVDLGAIPETVAIAPFVINILPIALLSGETYRLPALDSGLADFVGILRDYLRRIYPGLAWDGDVVADTLVDSDAGRGAEAAERRVGVLFTGGVDSYFSLSHYLGNWPVLIGVRSGADLLETETRWAERKAHVEAAAAQFATEAACIDGNPFEFVAAERLPIPSWWNSVQYGTALVGVSLPLMYALGGSTVVIAASGTPNRPGHHGSHPELEGRLRVADIGVVYSGYHHERQAKVAAIIAACRERNVATPRLQVCYRSYGSDMNCSHCEKCLRTTVALIIEGADPRDYGFALTSGEAQARTRARLASAKGLDPVVAGHWETIQDRIRELLESGERTPFAPEARDFLQWLAGLDLDERRARYQRRRRLRQVAKSLLRPFPRLIRFVMAAERRKPRAG